MNNFNLPSVTPGAGASGVIQQSRTEVQPIAFRIAAGILLTASVFSLGSLLFGSVPNVVALIIDVWLAISLLKLSDSARRFTLFRAYAGAILWPILMFAQNDFMTALLSTVIQLAYCGSLILMLQGATKNWKIYLALGVFVVFVVCLMSILYLFAFINPLLQ